MDVVLISHPDLAHLGALPYARSKLGLRAQIYSTVPVQKIGQMFLYDAYLSVTERYANYKATNFDGVLEKENSARLL